MRRSCPVVVFHESEQHFPCSISHLLAHSTLQQRERNDPHAAARVLGHVSAEQLGTYQNTDQQEYCLSIAPSQFAGHTPVDGIVEAPVYVTLVEVENTFIDIYYVFVYAYQGSQTFRCTPPVLTHFNCIASDFGRHQGDVEHFIVRTTPTFSRILSVAYEAHGEQAWFFPGMRNVHSCTPKCDHSCIQHVMSTSAASDMQGIILHAMDTLLSTHH